MESDSCFTFFFYFSFIIIMFFIQNRSIYDGVFSQILVALLNFKCVAVVLMKKKELRKSEMKKKSLGMKVEREKQTTIKETLLSS